MTFIQRRLNVDATSWRCIDVEATLYKMSCARWVCFGDQLGERESGSQLGLLGVVNHSSKSQQWLLGVENHKLSDRAYIWSFLLLIFGSVSHTLRASGTKEYPICIFFNTHRVKIERGLFFFFFFFAKKNKKNKNLKGCLWKHRTHYRKWESRFNETLHKQ